MSCHVMSWVSMEQKNVILFPTTEESDVWSSFCTLKYAIKGDDPTRRQFNNVSRLCFEGGWLL